MYVTTVPKRREPEEQREHCPRRHVAFSKSRKSAIYHSHVLYLVSLLLETEVIYITQRFERNIQMIQWPIYKENQ